MIDLAPNTPYNSFKFSITIPGGATAHIFIIENHDGNPFKITCNIGKSGLERGIWANALERTLSFALQNTSLDEVIGLMSDVASDRFEPVPESVCRSGPEAFAIALREYRNLKEKT